MPGYPLDVTFHGRYFQIFVLSLSAPFTTRVFGAQLLYIDHPIGSEAGVGVSASADGLPDPKDLPAVTKAPVQQPNVIPPWIVSSCLPMVLNKPSSPAL